VKHVPPHPVELYEPERNPSNHPEQACDGFISVSVVEEHTMETICVLVGFEHAVHVPAEPTALYAPLLNPDAYWLLEHVCVAICVFVVVVHDAVVYCIPDGFVHCVCDVIPFVGQ